MMDRILRHQSFIFSSSAAWSGPYLKEEYKNEDMLDDLARQMEKSVGVFDWLKFSFTLISIIPPLEITHWIFWRIYYLKSSFEAYLFLQKKWLNLRGMKRIIRIGFWKIKEKLKNKKNNYKMLSRWPCMACSTWCCSRSSSSTKSWSHSSPFLNKFGGDLMPWEWDDIRIMEGKFDSIGFF